MEEFLNDNEVATLENTCPGCGAGLVYDIQSGNLRCAHCGTMQDIDKNSAVERRLMTDETLKAYGAWDEASVFSCNGCGAKEVLDKKDLTRLCPFCGSAHVVAIEEVAGVRPDSVIPFQITKDGAVERFRKWLKGRWLAPRSFKTADIRTRMNGVYTSCWSFTAQAESTYNGTLGRRVQTTRRDSRGQLVTSSKIRYFRVNGQMVDSYLDHFVQSGDRISPAMFAKIRPFDLKLIKVYRQEFLAGIIAEHYARNLETCFNEFANFVRADMRRKIMRRHNADVVQSLNLNVNYRNRKFNYVLLPIYIANYLYNKKLYNFYVNGASGTVVGKYPKSKFKIALIVFGAGLVAAAGIAVVGVGYSLGWFGGATI